MVTHPSNCSQENLEAGLLGTIGSLGTDCSLSWEHAEFAGKDGPCPLCKGQQQSPVPARDGLL